jgi:cell division protein FtsB
VVQARSSFAPPKARYLRAAFHGKHLAASPRLRWGLVAVLLALYVAHFVYGDHGIMRRMELRKDMDQVAANNVKLRLEKEQLLHEVQLKENDPLSLERLAREKYWMIGPGETVYRFREDDVVPDVPLPGQGSDKAPAK